jgi:bacillithiol biosynthesis deacetylase BshB1
MKLDVLAIGAHPDDIELTCSGTIIKLVREGKKVGILDITEGELGTRGSRAQRSDEARAAASLMGVSHRENLNIADGNIVVNRENILSLIQVIRRWSPDTLLIPFGHDRHPDHVHAHTLCREAWFYAGLSKIQTVHDGIAQDPYRPLRFYQFMQWHEFEPSFIVDVTDCWDQRMDAVRAYKSQFYDPNSPDPQTILSTPNSLTLSKQGRSTSGTGLGSVMESHFCQNELPAFPILMLCSSLPE